jgi:hypothetical protein
VKVSIFSDPVELWKHPEKPEPTLSLSNDPQAEYFAISIIPIEESRT